MLALSFEHRFENFRGNSPNREVAVQTANSELEMHINTGINYIQNFRQGMHTAHIGVIKAVGRRVNVKQEVLPSCDVTSAPYLLPDIVITPF